MSTLSPEQLDDLQTFLKDWLRHTGRTQSDLRRALQASSIRMPILLESLQATVATRGLAGLAEQLCGIEARWQAEEAQGGAPSALAAAPELDESLGQLDLLLREIRGDQAD